VQGWLEAIQAHPKLGDKSAVREKFLSSTTDFQRETALEQDRLMDALDAHIHDLAEWNRKFESKFGHKFLLCAEGKSIAEVLSIIKGRCDAYASWRNSRISSSVQH
jgi:2-oxo-4-hydroxy-4-carboxy--5-ureidoimidazoline (OHCU) decarboxylase